MTTLNISLRLVLDEPADLDALMSALLAAVDGLGPVAEVAVLDVKAGR